MKEKIQVLAMNLFCIVIGFGAPYLVYENVDYNCRNDFVSPAGAICICGVILTIALGVCIDKKGKKEAEDVKLKR